MDEVTGEWRRLHNEELVGLMIAYDWMFRCLHPGGGKITLFSTPIHASHGATLGAENLSREYSGRSHRE